MTGTRRPPTVHKFGGASLADSAAMHHAVAVIQDLPPGPAVIVASAMAGVTDRLLGLALQAAGGKPADSATLSSLRRLHVDAARQIIRTAGTRRGVLAAIETSLNELRALLDGLRVVRELSEVPGQLAALATPGDLIVLLGAGSIGAIAGAVLRSLEGQA